MYLLKCIGSFFNTFWNWLFNLGKPQAHVRAGAAGRRRFKLSLRASAAGLGRKRQDAEALPNVQTC